MPNRCAERQTMSSEGDLEQLSSGAEDGGILERTRHCLRLAVSVHRLRLNGPVLRASSNHTTSKHRSIILLDVRLLPRPACIGSPLLVRYDINHRLTVLKDLIDIVLLSGFVTVFYSLYPIYQQLYNQTV